VLVVDDDSLIADTLRMILEAQGYRVSVAHNGLDALHLLAQERPSLVITDRNMPVMDGLGLIRRINDDPGLRATRIVLMSAMAEPEPDGLVYHRFLPKPSGMDTVLKMVAELIPEPSAQPSLPGRRTGTVPWSSLVHRSTVLVQSCQAVYERGLASLDVAFDTLARSGETAVTLEDLMTRLRDPALRGGPSPMAPTLATVDN
jgi:CheY-like chemotaxis protein